MKRVDWVLVGIVLVPVLVGLLRLLALLARGVSYGVSPAEVLLDFLRRAPGLVTLLAPLLAAFLAMVLLWRLQVRGVKPVPTIVLTIGAWCVLTLAVWFAILGFWWPAIGVVWF